MIARRRKTGTPVALDDSVPNELPIFLNADAGRGAALQRDAVRAAFEAAGARPLFFPLERTLTRELVCEQIAKGARTIAAAGGDGTISAIANVLAGTDAALLPVPLGTLNHFAKRYGITSVEAAVHAWKTAPPTQIHVGCVNDMVFVNNASAGFYPHMVRHRERLEIFLPRIPAMWLAGLRSFVELPMLHLEMKTATEHRVLKTPALWVGIGCNSLRLPVRGDAEIKSAVLEAVSGRAQTRLGILALAFSLLRHLRKGLEPRDRRLDVVRAPCFTVRSSHSVDVALDGEPHRLGTPLNFSVREHGLRLIGLVAPSS